MNRQQIIESLTSALASSNEQITCAYLFGSLARNEAGDKSDVDVAVLFNEPPPKTLIGPVSRLQGELEQAVRKPVDLVALNEASPDFVHRVLTDSVLLNENDRNRRVAFEVQLRNAYFDILPYLQEYRAGGRA
jgi:predicted nucleotidyltransferase